MEQPVISVNRVEKTLPSLHLGPIDLRVERGVIVAVVGPNGSGKTSLFHLLMNIQRPDRGEIRIFGEAVAEREVGIKRRIGYVPDSSYAEEAQWRVSEAAGFHAHWYPNWNWDKWRELAERFELDPNQRVNAMSKGMKRRLLFSLALAQEPELLLLDEPSSGIDPFAWRKMLDEIRRFMERGDRTVLLSTHVIEEVRRIADYVAFLHRGRLIEYREKDALLDEWKTFWIEGGTTDPESIPGVVAFERGALTRLTTRSAAETEDALYRAGVPIVRRQSVELDELMQHLVHLEKT